MNDDTLLKEPVELPNSDPPRTHKPSKSRKSLKKPLLAMVVLLGLVGAGFGAYSYFSRPKTAPVPAKTTSNTKPVQIKEDVPVAGSSKEFENLLLRIKVNHPENWQVSEQAGGVSLISPEFSYETVDKGTVQGTFRVYIRKGAREVDGKYIGRGVAVEPSQKLSYAKPTSAQRKETNLTNFGFDDTDKFSFFMITSDYNLKKGDTLGKSYGREVDTYIVSGGFGTKEQADDFGYNSVGVDRFKTMEAYKQAVDIVASLQIEGP